MASILKVDALQGITAAGDITVTSEGGAATQSLQQGLAKAWSQSQMYSSNTINDSLNTSSLADNGAGDFTLTTVSAFGNTAFCMCGTSSRSNALQDKGTRDNAYNLYRTTTTQRAVSRNDSGSDVDSNHNCVSFHGDLA
jgi:hypothetical protein